MNNCGRTLGHQKDLRTPAAAMCRLRGMNRSEGRSGGARLAPRQAVAWELHYRYGGGAGCGSCWKKDILYWSRLSVNTARICGRSKPPARPNGVEASFSMTAWRVGGASLLQRGTQCTQVCMFSEYGTIIVVSTLSTLNSRHAHP